MTNMIFWTKAERRRAVPELRRLAQESGEKIKIMHLYLNADKDEDILTTAATVAPDGKIEIVTQWAIDQLQD